LVTYSVHHYCNSCFGCYSSPLWSRSFLQYFPSHCRFSICFCRIIILSVVVSLFSRWCMTLWRHLGCVYWLLLCYRVFFFSVFESLCLFYFSIYFSLKSEPYTFLPAALCSACAFLYQYFPVQSVECVDPMLPSGIRYWEYIQTVPHLPVIFSKQ
jgi:hypothetical protein